MNFKRNKKDILSEGNLNRREEKFWQGAGIREMIFKYAGTKISDFEFLLNRKLKKDLLLELEKNIYIILSLRDILEN